MTRHKLETYRNSRNWESHLFYMDETSPWDLIEYWNYRALGWKIIPFPAQLAPQLTDSHIIDPYYFGFGTAAAHYGLTTQIRNVIYIVAQKERRARSVHDARVHIVKQTTNKFFGFSDVDVLGYKVKMSDREKTSIDWVDHPEFAGGVGEAASILATATRRYWDKAVDYLARVGEATRQIA